jgi:uncharacterized membrane protein
MSTTVIIFWTIFLSFLPISELRGAIPFAIADGIPWYFAFLIAVFFNALIAPVCWVFLSTLHKLFLKMKWYNSLFQRFIERARSKLHLKIERWGWVGLAIFVGIPLPITGAWTGTLGAWVLGLSKRKTMLAVFIGVIAAGVIVSVVVLLGVHALDLFIKKL